MSIEHLAEHLAEAEESLAHLDVGTAPNVSLHLAADLVARLRDAIEREATA